MKYLIYENHIFKQAHHNELDFFSLKNPNLYFTIKIISELGACPEIYEGTLCKDNNQNVIKRGVLLNIIDDARDLITKENVVDWLICVKQSKTAKYTRDIYFIDEKDDETGFYQSSYFGINLSDTLLESKFEYAYELDIYNFDEYKLYHKEFDGNYYLVCDNIREI